MDYFERIGKAIHYIESNIKAEISLAKVADEACCSLFYFHRIFTALVGDTLKEYIRKRRMTLAANDLVETDKKIIDIAIEYGFNTQESFSRCFKEHFSMTPAKFRKNGLCFVLRSPGDMEQLKRDHQLRSGNMEPKIVKKESFTVIGPQIETSPDGTNFKEIPLFWQKYLTEEIGKTIPNRVKPCREYGICAKGASDPKKFIYMIGAEVTSTDKIPAGMVARTIPTATYAVFTSEGPMPETIQKVTKYIYGTWLPNQTEYERAETEDFELYDERCMQEVPIVEIYVPIKKK
jgi:AraC family transcriptional regulator